MSLKRERSEKSGEKPPKQVVEVKALTLLKKPEGSKILPPFLNDLPGELRNIIYRDLGLREPSGRTYLYEHGEHALARVLRSLPGPAFAQLREEVNSHISHGASWEIAVMTRYRVYSLLPGYSINQYVVSTFGYGSLVLAKDHWMREHSKQYPITTAALRIFDDTGTLVARICLVAPEEVANQTAIKKRATRKPIAAPQRAIAEADGLAMSGQMKTALRNAKQKKHYIGMTVREVALKMIAKPLKSCTDKARKLIAQWDDPGFRGFTIDQLEQIAACFEWEDAFAKTRKRARKTTADSGNKRAKRVKES